VDISLDSRVVAIQACLGDIRSHPTLSEFDIHTDIKAAFAAAGIQYEHEVRLGVGCRIDFVAEGIGIEVKRGKPNSHAALKQLARYASHPDIQAIMMVVERNIWTLPSEIEGKPVYYISLNSNWGIAL